MSSTPAASYTTLDPPKQIAYAEPRPLVPYVYEDGIEHFVYGKWEYDLMDAPRDCMARSLPCVPIAQISARVHAGSYKLMLWKQITFHIGLLLLLATEYMFGQYYVLDRDESDLQSFLIAAGVIFVIVMVVSYIWAKQLAALRKSVRDRFQIEGSTSDDMWAVCCCLSCAIAQMARQTKSSDPYTCDMEPRDALPPYQP